MSQHDYVLANAAGAAVRTDLNDALSAIVTLNSSTVAPTTTYAYMLWADSSAGTLYQRNAADSAWVEKGSLSSTYFGLLHPDNTSNLTAGYTTDVEALGSTTATVSVAFTAEHLKTLTVDESFTLAEPNGGNGACAIFVTNDSTGGYTITTTGYETVGSGTYDDTASAKNLLMIWKEGSNSYLQWLGVA